MRLLKTSALISMCVPAFFWMSAALAAGAGLEDDVVVPRAGIDEPVQPIPLRIELDPGTVALGRRLFFDPRLSRDGSVSCASCHDLSAGGDDGRRVPRGVGGAQGTVNTLTVFNAAGNVAFFWDGRARTLEEQIAAPITGDQEMGARWPRLIERLNRDPVYRNAFLTLYPRDGARRESVIDALATFVRSLITPNSPFDRYLRGDESAISARAQEGYRLFKHYGCSACHQGRNVGGNMFQVIGVMKDYNDHGAETGAHLGRYNVTGRDEDLYKYRVPGLRNVARTAPYFHDGRAETLEEAVKDMARHQIGRSLKDGDVALIVEFLETLTGEYRGEPL